MFRRRGSQWIRLQRGQRGSTCVDFHCGLVGGRNRGGRGASQEGPRPIVFKDLDGQRRHQGQQAVGDVSQDQLLVSITADTNVGGAGLEQVREGGDNVGETSQTGSLGEEPMLVTAAMLVSIVSTLAFIEICRSTPGRRRQTKQKRSRLGGLNVLMLEALRFSAVSCSFLHRAGVS